MKSTIKREQKPNLFGFLPSVSKSGGQVRAEDKLACTMPNGSHLHEVNLHKAKSKIFSLIIFVVLLNACGENWVDTTPYGTSSTAYQWTSEDMILRSVAAMYTPFNWESLWGRDLFWMQNASDDIIVGRTNANAINIKDFICTGNEGYMSNAWEDLYWMLEKANVIIENIDNATNVEQALINRSKGEAYFIRAFAHFWIASLWGRDDQGIPYDGPENEGYGSRIPPQLASVQDNYAQIVSDLIKASELLPYFEEYSSEYYGRPHKVAAWGYMVKVYAYWAALDNSKWGLIPDLCDKIANEGKRALLTIQGNPEESYRSIFKIANNWSSEYIWSVTSGTSGGSEFPGVILENKGWGLYNGWGYFQPTEELYTEFENDDPRREVSILKFGDEFTFLGQSRRFFSTNSLSGFQINKYMEPYSYGTDGDAGTNAYINQNGNYPTTCLNLPLMRYAEILLFKAEAYLMQGNVSAAAIPLNEVRNRVGLDPISFPTMDDLKHERRCELALEWTDRFHDLKRWGDYDKIRMALHGRIHASKTDPDSNYSLEQVWPVRTFKESKDIVWPYPPSEIAKANGAYKQNPEW